MKLSRVLPFAAALAVAASVATAALLPAPFALASSGSGFRDGDDRIEKKVEIVLRVGGETLKLDEELEPGQSRSLRTESGAPATVRRDGNELVISVLGTEKRVKVLRAEGEGFAFSTGGPSCSKMKVRKQVRGGAAGRVLIDEECELPATCCLLDHGETPGGADCLMMLGGDPLAHVDLDALESLRGAGADVKAKVREALAEIRRSRKAMVFEKTIVLSDDEDGGEEKVVVRGGDRKKKVIVMVDGDDDDRD